MNCIYLHVQIHMSIDPVYSIRISRRKDLRRKMPTVIVGAIRGHWWNYRKRCVDGGNNSRIMWQCGKTLWFPESERSSRTRTDRAITLIPLIQAARSAEVMLLHSCLTTGESQAALTEVNKAAETNAMRRKSRKAIVKIETKRRN